MVFKKITKKLNIFPDQNIKRAEQAAYYFFCFLLRAVNSLQEEQFAFCKFTKIKSITFLILFRVLQIFKQRDSKNDNRIILLYVIVIARDRVQYEIYFPSSDIFVSLFSEPSGEENNNKNIRTRKIYPYCTSNMR